MAAFNPKRNARCATYARRSCRFRSIAWRRAIRCAIARSSHSAAAPSPRRCSSRTARRVSRCAVSVSICLHTACFSPWNAASSLERVLKPYQKASRTTFLRWRIERATSAPCDRVEPLLARYQIFQAAVTHLRPVVARPHLTRVHPHRSRLTSPRACLR
jgi:hypothetical protein